jgi:N-glycosidase YbiA
MTFQFDPSALFDPTVLPITRFKDENGLTNHFLSNFHEGHVVLYLGRYWPTSEHAYQAAKTLDEVERDTIAECASPGMAKRKGLKLTKRPDWDEIKIEVMREILRIKFAHPELRARLLATGDAELIEGNYHDDDFWGQCPLGNGENWLGRLRMELRAELRCQAQTAPA